MAIATLATALLSTDLRSAEAHAIHTTLTELTREPNGDIRIRVRAFADDLSAAVARHTRTKQSRDYRIADPALSAYANAMISIADSRGNPLRLSWTSQRREGDVVWFELRGARVDGSLGGARFRNAMLFEMHEDQVNIVQTANGSKRHTTVFSRGDGAKRLP